LANSIHVHEVTAGYGSVQVLDRISLEVNDAETVALLGTNGNGKSTLMKCIMGIVVPKSGRITARIDDVDHELTGHRPEEIVELGISMVPEGRRLFPRLDVEENLLLGAHRKSARAHRRSNLEFCFETFPVLAKRRKQLAGSMSGGEQQMLTLARALMTEPKILLIDEPSVGLSPLLVIHTIDKIRELKERRALTVLMAEQNFHQAIKIADRGYVIVHGKMAYEGRTRDELSDNELVRKLYLGM
jgi:branched-chain amino acid transport system ATP-binding protein